MAIHVFTCDLSLSLSLSLFYKVIYREEYEKIEDRIVVIIRSDSLALTYIIYAKVYYIYSLFVQVKSAHLSSN